jgi:hypothetical protein
MRLRGNPITADKAYNYWLDSPVLGEHRKCTGSSDYGDVATIGLSLKRDGVSFHEYDDEIDFAFYLGEHTSHWVVAIKNLKSEIIGGEEFPDLESLKRAWVLD